jgi:hypothetical protein
VYITYLSHDERYSLALCITITMHSLSYWQINLRRKLNWVSSFILVSLLYTPTFISGYQTNWNKTKQNEEPKKSFSLSIRKRIMATHTHTVHSFVQHQTYRHTNRHTVISEMEKRERKNHIQIFLSKGCSSERKRKWINGNGLGDWFIISLVF